jgi:poly(glycerol-phosphate) alpha-glucosyltransferase
VRVAFILSSLSRLNGGISESVRRLAQSLPLPRGHVVAFGLRDACTEADAPLWAPIPTRSAAVRGPRAFGYAPELARLLDAYDPDIAHAAGLWMYPSVVSMRRARRTRRPAVIAPHGMLDAWALANSAWKKRIAFALYERAHLESAACLHALCAAEADAIRAFGLKNPIAVIPNGVDLPDVSAPPPPPPWEDRGPVLLFLGRLHPKKGLQPLVEAWAAARDSEWRLAIAGWDQGGYGARIEALARERGARDSILMLGPLHGAEKAAAYRGASGFVLPSYSEGLPMTVLEAWSFGCPVLMTAACNLPEGFRTGAAIEISADPRVLAEQLRAFFLTSPDERRAIGLRGRALAERAFSWAGAAEKTMALYAWLAGGPRPAHVIIP